MSLTIGLPSYADPRVWDVLTILRRDARAAGVVGKFDVVVVENSPASVQGQINAKTAKGFGAKFVAMPDPVGTAPPRNRIFEEATTDWVLVMDSHVYLDHDVLPRLLEFTDNNHSLDLHYGPLLNSAQIRGDGSLSIQWTHWSSRIAGDGLFGGATTNPAAVNPDLPPFLIEHSGCGLFLARRDAWLGFHQDFRGFGVEGYLGRKYWAAGRQVWCQPWLKWLHWFRDKQLPPDYPHGWFDRTRNMVIQWRELGSPKLSEIKAAHVEHYRTNKETGQREFVPRTTPAEWQRILDEYRIDEAATIAAETAGNTPAPPKAPTNPTDEDYLAALPCRFRKRKSGSILCNMGCQSNQSRSHSLYDCGKLGVVTLSRVRSDLPNCAFCEKREAPAEARLAPSPEIPGKETADVSGITKRPAVAIPEPPAEFVRWGEIRHGKPAAKPARPELVIVGRGGLGSVKMRGQAVAERLGVPFVDCRSEPIPQARTILLVKHWPEDPKTVRDACERLIHDPLDLFWQAPHAPPVEYWRGALEYLRPDIMLATSPACADLMAQAGSLAVVVAPHHADERVGTDWYDPNGPVVYAGLREFLGDLQPAIESACKAFGREFVARHDPDCWQALDGAALVLSVRFGRSATSLNKACKPQIKLANAARAGIQVLSTDDPAVTSLCPLTTITTDNWREDIERALAASPPVHPWNLDTHCDLIRGLL